ncbi:MAG TPA: hypothetical protein VMT60_04400 [Candidatus Bathyarchaeia archaeon]|nr:hypothetical protein [Candidatus Bathyarchaeia archaeon]
MKARPTDPVIGYYGFPRRAVLREARERFGPELPLVDLDVDRGAPDSGALPATTCRIIANIMDNAVELGARLAAIVAAVGEEKCDRGRHAALLLRRLGFTVIESRFPDDELENRPLVLSRSRLPLREKIDRIMATVVDPAVSVKKVAACAPTHGFWGVPPHDARILELFPGTTHVYGWVRCVEAGRPSDVELECRVDEHVPVVFFTQSFCAKQDLAHYLAEKHRGLAIDCHREINDSILAKVEAFVKLSGIDGGNT